MRCAVYGCKTDNQKRNRSAEEKLIRFRIFPKDEKLCELWKQRCGRPSAFKARHARICSKHFLPSDYIRNLKNELLGVNNRNSFKLKKDAVPSQYLPGDPRNKDEIAEFRWKNVRTKPIKKEPIVSNIESREVFIITELCDQCTGMRQRIDELQREAKDLREQLAKFIKLEK